MKTPWLKSGRADSFTHFRRNKPDGVYLVTIGALAGTFTVKSPPEPPVTEVVEEEEESPSTSSTPSTTNQPSAPSTIPQPSVSQTTSQTVTTIPAKSTNWPVIGGLIGGGVIIALLLVYFLVLRKRPA